MVAGTRPNQSDVKRVTGQLAQFTSKMVTILTLEITALLIERTPVDTGWARANWIPRIGSPFPTTAGTREGVSTGAQGTGLAQATRYKLSQGDMWIVNNVPYIGELNAGSSRQAPAAFVQQSIFQGVQTGLRKASRIKVKPRGGVTK